MEQKKQFGVIFFLIDQERIEKVGHFYRKLRYSQMHSNPGATLKIPLDFCDFLSPSYNDLNSLNVIYSKIFNGFFFQIFSYI